MSAIDRLPYVYAALITIWLGIVIALLTHNYWATLITKVKDKISNKKKDREYSRKKNEEKCEPNRKDLPIHLQEYYDALDRSDKDGMVKALQDNYKECPSVNGLCLIEVFCPECPLAGGGLVVRSGREGL